MEIGKRLKDAILNIRDISDIVRMIEGSDKYHSVEFSDISHFNVSRYKSKNSKEPMPAQKVKIGRFFRSIFDGMDDSSIEYLSNRMLGYNKVFCGDIILKKLKGDDIINAYSQENYYEGIGTLGNSCMRHSNKKDFLNLYTQNENCEILVSEIDGKVASRALLWTLDDGSKFVDRVYSIYDYMTSVYEDYAIANNYAYSKNRVILAPSEDGYVKTNKLATITLTNIPELFPYLDTFSVLYNNKLYSYEPEMEDNVYVYKNLRHTNGGYSENRLPMPLERGVIESYRHLLSPERTQWLVSKTSFTENDIQFIFNLSDRSFISLKYNLEKIINTNSDIPNSIDELTDILLKDNTGNFKFGLYKSTSKDYPEHFYNEDGSVNEELANTYNGMYGRFDQPFDLDFGFDENQIWDENTGEVQIDIQDTMGTEMEHVNHLNQLVDNLGQDPRMDALESLRNYLRTTTINLNRRR